MALTLTIEERTEIGRGKSVFYSFENFIMHICDAVSMDGIRTRKSNEMESLIDWEWIMTMGLFLPID